ncbi:acyltransferase family protein [Plantactinospora siamensis]|uniref:Acyltransferase family protein n=1 Tax=Plantactinospora siamensis TaxID=555372 RepID=A0ABV6NU44_9ACTN
MTQLDIRAEVDRRVDPDRPAGPRGDIQGLRAVAVLLILAGAAAPRLLPGGFVGLDVFFVLSGFFVTGMLCADLERTGRIEAAAFYAERVRRLLPAALLVLITCLLLTVLLLPRSGWSATGWDAMTGALQVLNWRLAGQPAGPVADPGILRHLWPLGVAVQAYLIWPLLLALALVGVNRFAETLRAQRIRMLTALTLVGAVSFGWAGWLAAAGGQRAYLGTAPRLWELAVGGAVALLGARLARLPRAAAAALAWAGLAAIVGAALLVRHVDGFPGWPALAPALGAAAVLAAGVPVGGAGPGLLLDRRPLQAVGAVSYPLYLWHWPLLVVATARFGALSAPAGLLVALAAAVPAVLTHRYVEQPLRRWPVLADQPRIALQLGAVCTSVAAAAGLLFQITLWPSASPARDEAAPPPAPAAAVSPAPDDGPPGAAVLGAQPRDDRHGAPVDRVARMVPDPRSAAEDRSDAYRHGCVAPVPETRPLSCGYGDRDSKVTVALVGDGQAAAWLPALQAVAAARHWWVVTYLKEACPLTAGAVALTAVQTYRECADWNANLRTALAADHPSLVLTSNSRFAPTRDGKRVTGRDSGKLTADGLRRAWSAIATGATRLVVLRDTPVFWFNPADCAAENRNRLTRCAAPRKAALAAGAGEAQERAVKGLRNAALVDLNDAVCPTDRCAPVIGGALVYQAANRITATYARTLGPRLAAALGRQVG